MDFLSQLGINLDKLPAQLAKVGWPAVIKTGAEVLIILYALVWLRARIRGTQAERLVKGVLVLVLACLASWFLGLTIITAILQQFLPVLILALIIVFQPEVRRGLGYLGKTKTFKVDLSLTDSHKVRLTNVIEQVISAVRELSRKKIGALIVVEPPEGETDYLTPGIPINADVSSNLLLSIFFPNSPLHDGAVVIREDKVVAAGVILPMTDNPKLSHRYGTRHRAAIGLSELHDGFCIVVSEETGYISAASRGMLVRYNSADELSEPLTYLYLHTVESVVTSPIQSFLALFGKRPARDTATGAEAPVSPVVQAEEAAQSDNLSQANEVIEPEPEPERSKL